MPARNNRGRFVASKPVDVRSEDDIPELTAMMHAGPITFVLIYADWCGHCTHYKPTWRKFEKIPGRKANIASVHHDMVEKIPEIKDAKIEGYPSVIEVKPTGEIEEYKVPGTEGKTNAIPFMRDEAKMREALTAVTPTAAPKDTAKPGPQAGIANVDENIARAATLPAQAGGSVLGSIVAALKAAGPAALLLGAHAMLPKRRTTYKSPKRSSRRASTRRNRRRS
jgi:thiol-disulfide isomerase/thioredoxin